MDVEGIHALGNEQTIFDFFSTREVATGIYLLLLIVWLSRKDVVWEATMNVVRAALKKVIIIPVMCMFGYAALIVYGLQLFSFWEWALLKDVILWVLFVAIPICFKAGTRKANDYPFARIIIDNFIWSAILEFFIGAFTFPLLVELIILPIFVFVTVLKDYDRDNPKHKPYQNIFDGIASIAGLLLLIFTIREAINTITTEGAISLLLSFSVPVVFSVAFLPVVYILAVCAKYHDLFVRIYIRNRCSKDELKDKKKAVFLACGISYRKILRFEKAYSKYYVSTICSANDDETFFDFVRSFKTKSADLVDN